MKTYRVIAVSALLSLPAAVFAQQPGQPVTHAQVKSELRQLRQAGYQPASADESNYPNDIQAAEARVAAQSGQTGIGGAPAGGWQSGHPKSPGQ